SALLCGPCDGSRVSGFITDPIDPTEKSASWVVNVCDTLSRMRVVVSLLTFLLIVISFVNFDNAGAQTSRPTLISHSDSTRAIAFESVTNNANHSRQPLRSGSAQTQPRAS